MTVPLQTGLKVIDAMIPIGRGQRELILGDRRTGKTAIAIDTVLNQRGKDVICVYCAIGQRASAVAKAIADLRDNQALEYTVVVVAEGNQPPGLLYIAPYAATSIAEAFMMKGRDVLIVYDDLTQHARAYREISLLAAPTAGARGVSGRYLLHPLAHARTCDAPEQGPRRRLPDRSANHRDRSPKHCGLYPNQPHLDHRWPDLSFAITVRTWRAASGRCRKISFAGGRQGSASSFPGGRRRHQARLCAVEELETFARFGARLDEATRKTIEHGRRIRASLKQAELAPLAIPNADRHIARAQRWTIRHGPASAHERRAAGDLHSGRRPAEQPQRTSVWRRQAGRCRPRVPHRDAAPRIGAFRLCCCGRQAMSATVAGLRRKIDSANDLRSVVRAMKAQAAASIEQYERSVAALGDYIAPCPSASASASAAAASWRGRKTVGDARSR